MTGPRNAEFYSHPPMELILELLPQLHWRRCSDCNREQLYINYEEIYCICKDCGSNSTKEMRQATGLLKSTE